MKFKFISPPPQTKKKEKKTEKRETHEMYGQRQKFTRTWVCYIQSMERQIAHKDCTLG